ncbi:uncharacterized protein LOC110107899 [Dendrobium catenatum]|uniref:uncharacterized protein LOC110107899 n=1 Tax=Dendrobium catenatum TaxID=906689 RepID=UPI0009F70ECD|nr:uncharacterized protein LOC110107899 [Dendrobium catenatum]
MDLHSVGCKFTWFNQCTDHPIHIKLDRVLVNEGWVKTFTDSYCSYQSSSCSDHCPIIIHYGRNFQVNHRFLYKNYWSIIDKYWELLLDSFCLPISGNPLSHLCNSLRILKSSLKTQNWATSSTISKHMDQCLHKQKYILDALQSVPTNTFMNLAYKDANDELANLSSLQASWIIQRAKVNWLKHGEDDLKFLYSKIRTKMGGTKSVVNLLACNPLSTRADVVNSIIQYFQELYNPTPPASLELDSFPLGSALPDAHVSSIISTVTDDEIKNTVFSGSSSSALGPDGFNFHFYKTGWHILGPTICRAVHSFFLKGYMPNGVKSTALAIIPKHKNAASISDYRLIALCNVLYKIITKVMAARIKPIMCLIVKDNRAGFVKSRVSTDNILLASDILYYAGKRGGANLFFCAKLDFKKAFDCVSRQFLLARLLQKVLNGALEGYFSSTAGLRQGCPLSLYLFCLVMDAFSNLLEGRGFKGVTTDNYSLTHLLYADDVLIFGEATTDNCKILASVLRDFANSTGLYINYEKSSIMFPKHLRNHLDICHELSIHTIVDKITYLGIPLSFYWLKIGDFLPLLDCLNRKLNGWKDNLLSFAGRLQYLKFTIQNTIAYWIRGSILPKAIYKVYKKLSSRFLFFGDVNSGKKLHMLSWDKICNPKSKGGLGIPSIQALQFAYHCSVIFRMYNCTTPLSIWLLTKYRSPWKAPLVSASKLWKSICKTTVDSKHCFKFSITQNSTVSLKWDHWCHNLTLGAFIGDANLDIIHDIPLSELIFGNTWDLSGKIHTSHHQVFYGMQISDSFGACLSWNNSKNVCFKLFIDEFYSEKSDCCWVNMIWHRGHILKHTVFVWLALAGGLKTAHALLTRNIHVPLGCSLCNTHKESYEMEELYRNFGNFLMSWPCWLHHRVPVPVPSSKAYWPDWTMMRLPLQVPWMVFGQPGYFVFYLYSESSPYWLGSRSYFFWPTFGDFYHRCYKRLASVPDLSRGGELKDIGKNSGWRFIVRNFNGARTMKSAIVADKEDAGVVLEEYELCSAMEKQGGGAQGSDTMKRNQ